MRSMQMATSEVENSAQVLSCKLKFVHDLGSSILQWQKSYLQLKLQANIKSTFTAVIEAPKRMLVSALNEAFTHS